MMTPRPHPSVAERASGSDQVSRPRRLAARSIRGAGFLLGAALASLYLIMAWDAPPDMSQAPLRNAFNFYLTGPVLLFGGPILLAGWIAARIDHRRPTD